MRPPSEGTLQQTEPGTWRCEYYQGGKKLPPITVHARSRAEARRLVNDEKDRRASGQPAPAPAWTVVRLADVWLKDMSSNLGSEKSIDNYRYLVNRHILPEFGEHGIHALTSMDIN